MLNPSLLAKALRRSDSALCLVHAGVVVIADVVARIDQRALLLLAAVWLLWVLVLIWRLRQLALVPLVIGALVLAASTRNILATAGALVQERDCTDSPVHVVMKKEGDQTALSARLDRPLDVTITITGNSPSLPFTAESHGRLSFDLLTFPGSAASVHYNWKRGGRGGVHDETAVYQLPYQPRASYKVIQGYLGRTSHYAGSQDEYAIDWAMPRGTVVRACREGIVAGCRADSDRGGPSRLFTGCANYLMLRQPDGTYAEYLHLEKNGVLVSVGQSIAAGQAIARSGNTGWTTTPHLHFAVFRVIDGRKRETLPVKFRTATGRAESLRAGQSY